MDPSLEPLLNRLDNLSEEFREVQEGVRKAIGIADQDPEMALTRARKVLELVVREMYQRRINEPPGTRPLENLIQRLVKDSFVPGRINAYATSVRELGNVGTHRFGEGVTAKDVIQSLSQLGHILEWYFTVERPDAVVLADAGKQRLVGPDPGDEPNVQKALALLAQQSQPVDGPETDELLLAQEDGPKTDEYHSPPWHNPTREGVLRLEGYSFRRTLLNDYSYLAEEVASGRVVTITVERGFDEDQLREEVKNTRAAIRLRHPGIIPVLDVFDEGNSCYVVRQHVEGVELGYLLACDSGRLNRLNVANLFQQIAEALGYAHAHGLVHRQLKPSKILVDEAGVARLLFPGFFETGTPVYCAPEQMYGSDNPLDGRTDIWSLGVILYECLTRGCRPFLADTSVGLITRIRTEAPRPPRQVVPTIPARLEKICLKCLSKRLEDRYATADDLAADLRDAARSAGTSLWRRLWPF